VAPGGIVGLVARYLPASRGGRKSKRADAP
jgi:hypothetical protein